MAGKPVQEQPALAEHIAYMNKLEERGELVLGGPFKDDLGAMGVLEAESLEAATKVTLSDPLVRGKVVTVEVHPWHPAAQGCVTARTW